MKLRSNRKIKMLDLEIERVTIKLAGIHEESEEYAVVAQNLERLWKIRNLTQDNQISPDTIALIAANLVGILLILNFEKLDVISTKAFGFIMKGRV